MNIVLVTYGKHESVDFATVHLFEERDDAILFINETRTGRKKHWTEAELVSPGDIIELMQPEEE